MPSWASVQEFATTLLAGAGEGTGASGYESGLDRPGSRSPSTSRPRQRRHVGVSARTPDAWGPEPPPNARPSIEDVAAGTLAEREAALKAMRTASVLESHDGVNGGLDVAGKFKKRRSDEDLRGSASAPDEDMGEHLVYIHHVQPSDTYAGVILKYRCQEDAFRKANGLWARDNIQVRKWLAIPVDACEVKGCPCNPPTTSDQVDLQSPAPEATEDGAQSGLGDDSLATRGDGKSTGVQATDGEEDRPWTHVKWVSLASTLHPVELARVPRKTLGYFPPRRKKSIHTHTTSSTPRGSFDVPSITLGSEPALGSPHSTASSRRHSFMNSRNTQHGPGTSTPSSLPHSRGHSAGVAADDDVKPAWMRRPGGVGSLGRHVRTPGPERDYFNTWARRHMPALAADSLPSMSIMGSETARFGFGPSPGGAETMNPGLVESPFEEGRDAAATARGQGSSGLEKAAATVENWLRSAWAKQLQQPGTPLLMPRAGPRQPGLIGGREAFEPEGDLIELADATTDDGRAMFGGSGGHGGGGHDDLIESGLLSQSTSASSGLRGRPVELTMRGRPSTSKNKKAD